MILGQQRLLDEEQPERLEHLCELLGERPVHSPVEVEADVHALRLRSLDPLHDVVELLVACRSSRAPPSRSS